MTDGMKGSMNDRANDRMKDRMKDRTKKCRILFVCLGNICRSPVAKGICRQLIKERGLEDIIEVDSCGTGQWHVGSPAHPETIKAARTIDVSLDDHRARQVNARDFQKFDLIVAIDRSNYRDLISFRLHREGQVVLLRDFDELSKDKDVPDPFYGGEQGFYETQKIIQIAVAKLLDSVIQEYEMEND